MVMSSRAEMMKRDDRGAIPIVWVLTDDRPGNTTQSIGLAQALGWPYQVKELQFTPLARTLKKIFGPFAATRRALDPARSTEIAPPWPDLIIATGWRPAQVARWIRKRSHGRTRVIQLGRKGGHVGGLFDVVISCSYFRLPPHPRRIEVAAPLTQVSPARLAEAAEWWRSLVAQARRPYVMALIGGATKRHRWDPTIARRLGEDVRAFAQTGRGTVFAITSRRTGAEATVALQAGLGDNANVHRWQPEQKDNPYLAYLALADVLVVTGESESMLAEAAGVGKPVYIYPLPEIPPQGLKARVKDLVVRYAYPSRQDRSRNGIASFVLAKICRGLIASGLIRPRRDLRELHQALVRRGVARFFGEPLQCGGRPPLREIEEVARKVKTLLGYETSGHSSDDSIPLGVGD
jgi:hypothetical protein